MEKLLTVTVPCYNSQDYMENCIDSLLVGGDRVEIIIIDDGSKDNTGAIADRYAEKFPDIVKVIHQENGGHGEGINQGLKNATGKYFKSVDSDDRLSPDFVNFLDLLEKLEKDGGVDLLLTNYQYVHADGKRDRVINFSNALPEGRVFTWDETRPFRIDQILMIHTVCFKTELMRKTGVVLPKHAFYEDNYMVYGNLRDVKKMYYLNSALYLYSIGREGQSVQRDVMTRRYDHQIRATELCFTAFHLDDIKEKRKKLYMRHELYIMINASVMYARLNGSEQALKDLENMWNKFMAFDNKWANHYKRNIVLRLTNAKGKLGLASTKTFYRLSHSVVRFN